MQTILRVRSIDRLTRDLRLAACASPDGAEVALRGLDAKGMMALARRIEATHPLVVTVERRPPLSHAEAVIYALIAAQAFVGLTTPLAAFIVGFLRGAA